MIRTRMSNLPRRRSRLGVTALLGLSALLAVAGCSAVPSTGPVHPGPSDLHQAEQLVQFNPLGPVVDSTKEDIVRGFVL
ncbi:MAG: hypothetical protein WCY76_10045, partial [Leucobacter sp.]